MVLFLVTVADLGSEVGHDKEGRTLFGEADVLPQLQAQAAFADGHRVSKGQDFLTSPYPEYQLPFNGFLKARTPYFSLQPAGAGCLPMSPVEVTESGIPPGSLPSAHSASTPTPDLSASGAPRLHQKCVDSKFRGKRRNNGPCTVMHH